MPPGFIPQAPPGLAQNPPHPVPATPLPIQAVPPHSPASPKVALPPVLPKSGIGKKAAKAAQPASLAKDSAAKSQQGPGAPKDTKDGSKATKVKGILNEEEFPSLSAVKSGAAAKAGPSAIPAKPIQIPGSKKETIKSVPETVAQPPIPTSQAAQRSPKSEKRVAPGILNIAAATKPSNPKVLDLTASTLSDKPMDLPLPSPVTKAAPKTLKIVSTPKTETVAILSSAPGTASATVAARTAIASHRPETPASEMISDTTSLVSTSRANSPPPSKPSHATRVATKSQARKQQKKVQKEQVDAIENPKQEQEVIQAPINTRKKKQKKEKPSKKAAATPVSSRPETPVAQSISKTVLATPEKPTVEKTAPMPLRTSQKGKNQAPLVVAQPDNMTKSKEPPVQDPLQSPITTTTATETNKPLEKQSTPASVFQQLRDSESIPSAEKLSIIQPLPLTNWRHESMNSDDFKAAGVSFIKSVASDEDASILLEGKEVRKTLDNMPVLLTPNGDCVRCLTPEEQDRYLELQRRVGENFSSPANFVLPRHQPASGFCLIKGRAVPNGPPGYFPTSTDARAPDPVNKIQRDEAIAYINQYVLPRLGLSTPTYSPHHHSQHAHQHRTSHGTHPLSHTGSLKTAAQEISLAVATTPQDGHGGAFATTKLGDFDDSITGAASTSGVAASHGDAGSVGSLTRALKAMDAAMDGAYNAALAGKNSPSGLVGGAAGIGGNGPAGLGGMGGGPLAPVMSLEDAESAMNLARRETEKIEKQLNQVIRKNRRLLLGSGN